MKVSVIIPAYNHERYITETIESVLFQTLSDFELIIINDGSNDSTEEKVLSIVDNRIKYYSQENQGAHAAINRGISLASGDYISILNSDDIYTPDRLKKCFDFLEKNKRFSVVISKVSGINEHSLPVSKKESSHIKAWLNWYEDALSYFDNDMFMPNSFFKNILITTSNLFARRNLFETIGGFLPLRYSHDWDMLLRIASDHNIHLIDEVLLKYRIHAFNTVHEADSELKVKMEVNWLIAKNITRLQNPDNILKIITSLGCNHYISPKTLCFFVICAVKENLWQLSEFDRESTVALRKLFSE